MLWLLEDALWPVVSGYLQHWMMSCFIWGLRAVSDAEVVVIKRNVTGKCVKSHFICELARCRRRSVAMEHQAGSGAAGCCFAVRGCGWQAAVTVVLLVHKLLLLVNLQVCPGCPLSPLSPFLKYSLALCLLPPWSSDFDCLSVTLLSWSAFVFVPSTSSFFKRLCEDNPSRHFNLPTF